MAQLSKLAVASPPICFLKVSWLVERYVRVLENTHLSHLLLM